MPDNLPGSKVKIQQPDSNGKTILHYERAIVQAQYQVFGFSVWTCHYEASNVQQSQNAGSRRSTLEGSEQFRVMSEISSPECASTATESGGFEVLSGENGVTVDMT